VQVRVLAVGDGGERVVRVATTEGAIVAEWVGDLPSLDEVVDIELEVGGSLALDRTIFVISHASPAPDDPRAVLGAVEAEGDGVLFVRVGDGLVLVEVEPAAARALLPGTRVAMLAEELRAYPTGI
jgi:hypothetical protein